MGFDGTIHLLGALNGSGRLACYTDEIKTAVQGREIVLVATTADAHREIAMKVAPFVEAGQIFVLNPGRTLGAIEFRYELERHTPVAGEIVIAEAQSLVYACRALEFGRVKVIGVKDKVLISAYPCRDNPVVIRKMNTLFGCFQEAPSVMVTSMENIGAVLHPAVVLFNAAAIERGESFYFYKDMTASIADFIKRIDQERLNLGRAMGIELMDVEQWVSYAYPGIKGDTLCEKIRNNPAYDSILAPTRIVSRLITEDVPTGLVPMSDLGDWMGVDTSLMKSIITLTSRLVGMNFLESGRKIKNIGMSDESLKAFYSRL